MEVKMKFFQTSELQPSFGTLQVHVVSEANNRPILNAQVEIYTADNFTHLLYTLKTDRSGNTVVINLPAPPIEYSLQPGENKPYSEYNIRITAPGYQTVEIYGSQILPTIGSTQPVEMAKDIGQGKPKIIRIGPNVLFKK